MFQVLRNFLGLPFYFYFCFYGKVMSNFRCSQSETGERWTVSDHDTTAKHWRKTQEKFIELNANFYDRWFCFMKIYSGIENWDVCDDDEYLGVCLLFTFALSHFENVAITRNATLQFGCIWRSSHEIIRFLVKKVIRVHACLNFNRFINNHLYLLTPKDYVSCKRHNKIVLNKSQ